MAKVSWHSLMRRYLTPAGVMRASAWLMLAGSSGLLIRAEVRRPAAPEGVVAHHDLVYRRVGGREARLDVYLPGDPPPAGGRPAIVAIHGGGWRGGSKRDYGPMAARLARHGYAVVAVDYALSRPGTPSWPANFEDVREAVRWTRRNAHIYGIDPDRIAALGASAGGHLAALLGTDPRGPTAETPHVHAGAGKDPATSARVQAVIDFYGPSDLLALEASPRAPATAVHLMLGGGPERRRDRYEAASPVRHVSPDDPPMLLIHGKDDTHVPVEQSTAMAGALAKAGVRHRLMVLEDARHGFGFRLDRRDLLPEILAYLRSAWDRSDRSGRYGPGE